MTNPRVKEVVRLHLTKHRRSSGRILLEGPQIVAEAVGAGVVIVEGFTTRPADFPDATQVSPDVLDKLSTTASANGIVAVAQRPEAPPPRLEPTVVLWDVSEPGNLGGLIRSAAAFAFAVLVVGGSSADPWSPKALRAGAGAHFHTTVAEEPRTGLAELTRRGWTTIATVPRDGAERPTYEVAPALLVGNEARGLDPHVITESDHRWSVPTVGVESLNVGVAGGIAMFELRRWIDAAEGTSRD